MLVMGVTRREHRATFRSASFFSDKQYRIAGITKDSSGNRLGNCVVDLFYTQDDTRAAQVLSDQDGNFTFLIGPSLACYIVAYKAGSPDVAGTTVNTLVGTAGTAITVPGYSGYFRSLTVNHTNVSSDQTDFPVLVSVTDATLATIGNGGHVRSSNGYDIEFFSDTNAKNKLAWEIERYVPSTGELIAWVKIPNLSSVTNNVFYIFYGDSSVTTDQSAPAAVWSNGFVAVYHLKDGTTLSAVDSLGNFNGTITGSPGAVAGQIGGGASFNGSLSNRIDLSAPVITTPLTLTAWFKPGSDVTTNQPVVSLQDGSNGNNLYSVLVGSGLLSIDNQDLTNGFTNPPTLNSVAANTWQYAAAVNISSTSRKIYLNADSANSGGNSALNNPINITTGEIGINRITGGVAFTGSIDEVHFANVARSAGWLLTEYNSQNSPGTFITVGGELTI